MPEGGPLRELGKLMLLVGLLLALGGVLLLFWGKLPGAGRLPGDILIRRERWTLYFPITTLVVISLVLSLVLTWLFRR